MAEPDLSGLDAALGAIDAGGQEPPSPAAKAASAPAVPAPSGAKSDGPDLSGLDAALNAVDHADATPKAARPPRASAPKPKIRMAAKVAPPPAEPQSWSDVGSKAVQNFLPSLKGQIVGAVEPLLPQNWGKDVRTAVDLAKGVGSKTGLINANDVAAKAKDEALVNAIGDYYAKKYGTMEGFKAALASDPASFLSDASAVLSIPAGGEGLLAKLPGVAGEAASAAARAAGAVSKATNPIGIVGRAASAVLPKSTALNAVGNLHGGVKRTIAKAFNGRLDPADLEADPAATAALQATVRQKGASPAAVKEALLRRFAPESGEAGIPRQTVTGQAAPYNAASMVRDAIGGMKGNVARAATELTGAAGPHESDLGEMLEKSQIAAHNQYVDNYAKVAAHPGEFDPSFAASLPAEIESNLKAASLPATAADMLKHPEYARGEAVGAMNWLSSHVSDLAANNKLTPQELMNARKSLSYLWTQSKGSDSKAIGSMIDALDSHIERSAQNGLYNGANGAQVAQDMRDAISSFRQYKQSYANTSNPTHGAVATAMKNLMPDQVRDPTTGMITTPAPAGSTAAAQGQIVSKLINPRTLAVAPQAEKLYGKLVDVMGGSGSEGEQAVKDFVRQSVTRTGTDAHGHTTLVASPDQIHTFLASPLAGKVFTPQEMSTLRQVAEAQRLLLHNPAKSAKVESLIGALAGRSIRTAGAATLGHVAGGPLGGFLAGSLEYAAESGKAARQAAKELRGAPVGGSLINGPGRFAAGVARNPWSAVPRSALFYGAQPEDGKAPADAQDVPDSTFDRMLHQESGNRQLDDSGEPITSAKGAIGAAQIRPTTGPEAAKLAGEEWDPDRLRTDAEYNIKLGRAYFQHQRERFGDDALAAAAYNAGPAAIQHALEREKERGGSWLDYVPDETKNYVKNVILAGGEPDRVMRKSGGRTETDSQKVERLVNRLIGLAKSAKKVENKQTEPLLNVPDELVVKALHIAQKAI